MLFVKVLLLLMVANGAPILAHRLLGRRFAWPIDGGRRLRDGRPLLGESKTWRGLLVAILATAVSAPLLGFTITVGVLVGAGAMLGDLASSFVKRRLGIESSGFAPGLDQVPESLLPLLLVMPVIGLEVVEVLMLVAAFFVLELLLSQVLYRLRIRKRPY